jgi:hypothetical protein
MEKRFFRKAMTFVRVNLKVTVKTPNMLALQEQYQLLKQDFLFDESSREQQRVLWRHRRVCGPVDQQESAFV